MTAPNLTALTTSKAGLLAAVSGTFSNTVLYTVPAGKTARIAKLVVANTYGSSANVDVDVIPAGKASVTILMNYTMNAYATADLTMFDGMFLSEGDALSISASHNSAWVLSGIELS